MELPPPPASLFPSGAAVNCGMSLPAHARHPRVPSPTGPPVPGELRTGPGSTTANSKSFPLRAGSGSSQRKHTHKKILGFSQSFSQPSKKNKGKFRKRGVGGGANPRAGGTAATRSTQPGWGIGRTCWPFPWQAEKRSSHAWFFQVLFFFYSFFLGFLLLISSLLPPRFDVPLLDAGLGTGPREELSFAAGVSPGPQITAGKCTRLS